MPKDKRVVVEFTCDWTVDDVIDIGAFLQEAIEEAKGLSHGETSGKYLQERLAECAYLKEVVGVRLLAEDETMIALNVGFSPAHLLKGVE